MRYVKILPSWDRVTYGRTDFADKESRLLISQFSVFFGKELPREDNFIVNEENECPLNNRVL